MAGRLLCQKLCTSGVLRPPALMAPGDSADLVATSRKTAQAILGNKTWLKRNNPPMVARIATTARATMGEEVEVGGPTKQTDESGSNASSAKTGGSTTTAAGGGGDEGGTTELSRKRSRGRAPARRGRSRDVISSLAVPVGMFDIWDPLTSSASRSLRQMIETVDRLFDESFLLPTSSGLDRVLTNAIRMPWDVVETDDAYLLRIDMPGLSKEEVKIHVEDRELVICGEHKEDGTEQESRSYAVYNTRVILPEDAKLDDIKAEFKNGVLNVVISKVKEEKKDVREIDVS